MNVTRTAQARERILMAAFQLFSQKGYLGASTREIAATAHVAEITIFRIFSTKENLFAEVLQSFSSIPAMSELIPCLIGKPYGESLEQLVTAFLERLEANQAWIQLLQQEMKHAPERVQQTYSSFLQRLFAVITDYFHQLQEQGKVRHDLPPEHIARAFHSLYFGYYHVENLLGKPEYFVQTRQELIRNLMAIFTTGSTA